MSPILFWTAIFGVLGYIVVVDRNAAQFVELLCQSLVVEVRRRYLMMIMHPRNPITNWIMERKMRKLARELAKELNLPEED